MPLYNQISIIGLLQQADLIVQIVMFLLAISSIWSWTIIFDKLFKFNILKNKTSKFESLFKNNKSLDEIFIVAKKTNDHPCAQIFVAAINEWKISDVKRIIESGDPSKKESLKQRCNTAVQIACNQSLEKLENNMQILAIIGSVAPFVGLFGTVWGIMNSFQGIAASKNTSLAIVAPGIAEALLATAFGLLAAIPAVFFYNIYSNKINKFSDQLQNFTNMVTNILSRELDN